MEPAAPDTPPQQVNGHTSSRDNGKLAAADEHIVPPYWQRHLRSNSTLSYASVDNPRPTAIRLEDHSEEHSEQSRVLWAKHISVDDCVVVTGTAPGIGDYVVWNCTVETLQVRQLSSASSGGQARHLLADRSF